MKPKKQNRIAQLKNKLKWSIFDLFDFVMTKFEQIKIKKNKSGLWKYSVLLFAFMMLPSFARADYTVDLTVDYEQGGLIYWTTGGNTQVAQSFLPKKPNINRISLKCGLDYGNNNYGYLYLCKGTPIATNYTVQQSVEPCNSSSTNIVASSSLTNLYCNWGNTYTDINFDTKAITPNFHYFWQWISTTTQPNKGLVAWSNIGYNNGQAFSYNSANSSAVDFAFKTYYDSTAVNGILNIENPVQNKIITDTNVINFVGTVSNGNGLQILIGAPNQSPGIDIFSAEFESNITYNYYTLKTVQNGEYWVWYYLTKGTTTTISTTTMFVEVPTAGALRRTIAMDEATICAGIDKTTFFGGIECGFKKVIAWAIYPSDEMTIDLQVSYDNFKGAFPFNAFYDLTDTLIDTMASTTVDRSGTFDVPMINKQGQIITLPVISSSSMASAIGSDNADLIRNTVSWAMWGALAFLVFIQFKKF